MYFIKNYRALLLLLVNSVLMAQHATPTQPDSYKPLAIMVEDGAEYFGKVRGAMSMLLPSLIYEQVCPIVVSRYFYNLILEYQHQFISRAYNLCDPYTQGC
ncbi:hypothetical protein J120_04915 [candidate division TM6 bacterium JCVI TM6SC1]|uniref:Uncharacterized protein n=1 Tax=candidate division TM6 bacterium JCVI TM6SC1 TaxID=1306947 RepID=A0A0D2JD70_9BACT|nr:hypothetical protein J120_04915 [candidate division TM6 bacterium JCVI TM6SC1]